MEPSQSKKTKIQFNRGRPHLDIDIPKDQEPSTDLNQSNDESHEVLKGTKQVHTETEKQKNP